MNVRCQAGPAADLLFDAFQFAFSPYGVATFITLLGIEYFNSMLVIHRSLIMALAQSGILLVWDISTAKQGRTLLGEASSAEASSPPLLHTPSPSNKNCR
jgi:hypothetical protein